MFVTVMQTECDNAGRFIANVRMHLLFMQKGPRFVQCSILQSGTDLNCAAVEKRDLKKRLDLLRNVVSTHSGLGSSGGRAAGVVVVNRNFTSCFQKGEQ